MAGADDKKRASSISNKTIDSVTFEKGKIDEIIADIQLDTKLSNLRVSQNPERPSNFELVLISNGLTIHFADIALMGDKYLTWFDPKLDDYKSNKEFYDEKLLPVYRGLRKLLLKYVPEKVRAYIEKTSLESSL
jgi:hypothetical protein